VAEGELTRLRRLEDNHLKELAALKKAEEEKVEGLSKRLEEVDKQWLALRQEVTAKSEELSATAKRWVDEIGRLDRGLAGESFIFLFPSPLPAFGCRLRLGACRGKTPGRAMDAEQPAGDWPARGKGRLRSSRLESWPVGPEAGWL
jgi:hypothetical protein